MYRTKDYYKILGVDKQADERKLSRKRTVIWHDVIIRSQSGDNSAEEKFKETHEDTKSWQRGKPRQIRSTGSNYHRYQQMAAHPGFDYGQWVAMRRRSNFEDLKRFVRRRRQHGAATVAFRLLPHVFQWWQRIACQCPSLFIAISSRNSNFADEAYHGTTRVPSARTAAESRQQFPKARVPAPKIRLRGRGIEGGDLYFTVKVLTHPVLSDRAITWYSTVAVDHFDRHTRWTGEGADDAWLSISKFRPDNQGVSSD